MKIKNTSPILNALPVMTIIVLIPAATPLLNDGTELMIIALLGEANIPIPAPTSTSGNTNSYIDVVRPISDNMKKPIADNNNPNGVNIFDLYLSYNIPLIGAKIAKAKDTGIRYIPALSGLWCIEGP